MYTKYGFLRANQSVLSSQGLMVKCVGAIFCREYVGLRLHGLQFYF